MNCSTYSLFLGDLSVFCTKEDLEQLFSPFGTITDIRIKQDMNTGKKLSYGFVEFDNINSAINVLKNMNGYVLCGRPLRIRWGANKTAKKPNEPVRREVMPTETSSVHVSYCVQMLNVLVTEESLRYLFGNYGYVVDATIKKAVCNNMRGSNEGYGFVHYANTPQGIESAINAVSAMNNVSVGGVHYKVGLSISLEKKLNDLMNGHLYAPNSAAGAAAPSMYYPQQPVYYPPAAPFYGAAAPSSYYANNQPQVYCMPPASVYQQQQQQILMQRQQQYYRAAAAVAAPAAAPVECTTSEESSVCSAAPESQSSAAAPATDATPAVYEITLPAAKKLDDDSCSSSSNGNAIKTLPAASALSAAELQKQLDDARGDCGAHRHSTIDVYQEVQEHVACVDIIDY